MSAGSCSPLDWFPVHLGSGGHSILLVAGEEAEVLSVHTLARQVQPPQCPALTRQGALSVKQEGRALCCVPLPLWVGSDESSFAYLGFQPNR